jgi:hypothetical protein
MCLNVCRKQSLLAVCTQCLLFSKSSGEDCHGRYYPASAVENPRLASLLRHHSASATQHSLNMFVDVFMLLEVPVWRGSRARGYPVASRLLIFATGCVSLHIDINEMVPWFATTYDISWLSKGCQCHVATCAAQAPVAPVHSSDSKGVDNVSRKSCAIHVIRYRITYFWPLTSDCNCDINPIYMLLTTC